MVFTLVPLERGMFALSFHYRQESLSQLSRVCSSGKISHFHCKMPCPSLHSTISRDNLLLNKQLSETTSRATPFFWSNLNVTHSNDTPTHTDKYTNSRLVGGQFLLDELHQFIVVHPFFCACTFDIQGLYLQQWSPRHAEVYWLSHENNARCSVFCACTFHIQGHTSSIAFRHLPPNSARIGYTTEGALLSPCSCPWMRSETSKKFGC